MRLCSTNEQQLSKLRRTPERADWHLEFCRELGEPWRTLLADAGDRFSLGEQRPEPGHVGIRIDRKFVSFHSVLLFVWVRE